MVCKLSFIHPFAETRGAPNDCRTQHNIILQISVQTCFPCELIFIFLKKKLFKGNAIKDSWTTNEELPLHIRHHFM